jgi:GNAT superfamily N-acetyltransferase
MDGNTSTYKGISTFSNCLAAYGKHITKSVGGRIYEDDNIVMCSGKFVSPYKNMVVPLYPIMSSAITELAKQIVDFYSSHDGWVMWNSFEDDLSNANFYAEEDGNPIMESTLQKDFAIEHCPEISIREVEDDKGVRLFQKIREEAYGDIISTDYKNGYLDGRALGNGLRLWLGYIEDEPVSTAGIFEYGNTSMIKNISTLPQFRGKGIGTCMSSYVANACTYPPLLEADQPARKIYARLGFRTIGTVNFWRLKKM